MKMVSKMSKKRKIIPASIKAKIMSEAEAPGCIIAEVATKYKISKNLLYSWRSKHKASEPVPKHFTNKKIQRPIKSNNNNLSLQPNFVELKVNPLPTTTVPLEIKEVKESVKQKCFKKLSLELEDFSLAIEGNISGKKLIALITILEQPC